MEIITTQSQAKARGLERYNGKLCKNGHTERYTNSRGCVECARGRSTAAKKPKPIKAASVADAAPRAYEPEKSLHRDPGTRVSPDRIAAFIEQVFNNGPRLGAPALAESEAA
jgi:hypothetical protein